jgi:D-tyrosyl-tRNA(Tyr) deacylase
MKVVLQTVNNASVKVNNKTIGSISRGYLLLVGFTYGDDKETVESMVDKIINLRVFSDENRKINLSLNDVNGEILSVSQFTLYADIIKGRRPSFTEALSPHEAQDLYNYFNTLLEFKYGKLSTGLFGADMEVISTNDGPFTLILDSKELW